MRLKHGEPVGVLVADPHEKLGPHSSVATINQTSFLQDFVLQEDRSLVQDDEIQPVGGHGPGEGREEPREHIRATIQDAILHTHGYVDIAFGMGVASGKRTEKVGEVDLWDGY